MKLRKPCEHGKYDAHPFDVETWLNPKLCLGGEFLAEDSLVIEKDPDEQWDRELVLDAVLDFLDREEVEETP